MINRRQFLRRSTQAAAGLALAGSGGWLYAAVPPGRRSGTTAKVLDFSVSLPKGLPEIVIAKGDSPAALVKKAIAAFGGMESFISKGDRVVLKPNASWDRTPVQGADTNPEVVGALVELSLAAGARSVAVIDHTIDEPRRCFARSGIGPAAKKAGGTIVFQGERAFRKVDLGGEAIGPAQIMAPLFEADKFINVPVVKQHRLSTLTAAMKNLYGIIGGNRPLLHKRIDETIVDLASFARPTLVVLDAFSVMVQNGPSGGRPQDLIHPHIAAVGTDQVAMDAYAASLLDLKPEDVGHVKLAHEKGLGKMNYKSLRTETLQV